MTCRKAHRFARLAGALATLAMAALIGPAPGFAASGSQVVSATTLGTLSISVPAPVVMTGLAPGSTATGTGALSVVSTNSSWTLGVSDQATGTPGHMVAGSTGCSGSASSLSNPLALNVTSALGGITSSGSVNLSGANQTVATGSGVLGTAALTTGYSVAVPATASLLTGCQYSLTATFTLQ